ncbi:potassium transporter Kef [Nocardia mangyaensis]|uniref:Potassium transporter Kef n=1 Tax=Nocardia mangyaensis TaxID=2213200 RepID=A0A1J0VZA6_9NOCA|nr:cation:proton antiporter family protein [Nocardia mangyaensis]APE37321.1 potassium transporter Kef [Nocardia mangyaensis]
MDIAFIVAAFAGGLVAMLVRLPPLVGFLVAGFVLNAMGYGLTPELETIADLGVTLLLFTIGLKLDVRSLARREIWGTATAHMAVTTLAIAGFIGVLKFSGFALLAGTGWSDLLLLGFALSFSSTVFAVKVLDERGEATALYGRIAIGVLVMQDIFAVVFITASTGNYPSLWALLLLLLIPLAPLLHRVLDRIGHGEMQVLFGVVAALVLGYSLFDLVGVKGDLGALLLGMVIAPAANAAPLAKSLFSLKELFLVGFFLSIGLTAMPTVQTFLIATALLLLIPLKGALFTVLFLLGRLRARTALLAGLTLSNYSEFGLIVGALAASKGWLHQDWLVVIALTVAMSFTASAVLNSRGESLYRRYGEWLKRREHAELLDIDQHIQIDDAQSVVLGMGRVGRGAYDRLRDTHGLTVVGVEQDPRVIAELRVQGYRVVQGDAADSDFWERVTLTDVELIVLAMPHQQGNLAALDSVGNSNCQATIAGIVTRTEDIAELRARGADHVFHLYGEAGKALADDAIRSRTEN